MRAKKKIDTVASIIVGLTAIGIISAIGLMSWQIGNDITERTGISIYLTSFTLPVVGATAAGVVWVISWAFEN